MFTLSSEYEKGISAHGNLTVGGEETSIEITKSTEGIESKNVATINDGIIRITSSDDGINATGGQSMSEPPMMPGGGWGNGGMPMNGQNATENGVAPEKSETVENEQTTTEKSETAATEQNTEKGKTGEKGQNNNGTAQGNKRPTGGNRGGMGGFGGMGRNGKLCLVINGGDIEINAGDDCLDANGNMEINGGLVKAVKESGTFTGNMGIIDADGQITIGKNASVLVAGRGGTQGSFNVGGNTVTVYCDSAKTADDKITVSDESGNAIMEYAPDSGFSAVMIISPEIEIGKTYKVSVGDETHEVSVSEQNSVVGTAQSFGGGGRNQWPR